MLDWYSDLGAAERRTFWACFGGWALDALDVQIYTFAVPTLIAVWHISNAQAGLLATSALVISAFGGWVAGMLADRVGRARLLMVMVAWFAFFTFLSGFTNSFEQLLVARGFQGFGFGGEWAAGSVLIGEVVRGADRGKAVGTVQSAWAWGYSRHDHFPGVAAGDRLARSILCRHSAGALGVLHSQQGPRAAVLKQATQSAARRGSFEIFGRELLPTTILGAALTTGAQGGYYAITTFLPTFLRTQRHLTVMNTGGYLAVIIIGSWCGYIVSTYLSDAIGRRKNFFIFAVRSLLIAIAYSQSEISNWLILVLGFPLGFFASGIFSGMGPVLTELFPTSVRGTGQGFCYNFGRGIAAFFPTLVGLLSASVSLGSAIGIFAAISYAIVILAALALPETRGRELLAN
jgi:MFS family permease